MTVKPVKDKKDLNESCNIFKIKLPILWESQGLVFAARPRVYRNQDGWRRTASSILPEIPKLSNIYIDNDLVGFYSESYTEDGLYFFKIYTENLEAFQVGNRLNLGTLNVVFTIVNTTLIGNNLCLILDRVSLW